MLMSVDGKISTGDADIMDVDRNFPQINGLKEGLQQYYDLEQTTDLFSLNTGCVFAKVGCNEKTDAPAKLPVTFVVIDNQPHLTKQGISYLAKKAKDLILVTTNKEHPVFSMQEEHANLHPMLYAERVDFADLFRKLKIEYKADALTIQSGGTLNATLVRAGLIDRVLLVVAPALIGGNKTATLIDGDSLHAPDELSKIKTLELIQAKPLDNSYLLLEYRVKN